MNKSQGVPSPTANAERREMLPHGTLIQDISRNGTRPGYRGRVVTGIIQAITGCILFVCGIVVVSVHIPPDENDFFRLNLALTDGIDTLAGGIWIGACIVFTSLWGILSEKSQVRISLYMAFSIVVCVFSGAGFFVAFVRMIVCNDWKNSVLRNRAEYEEYVANALGVMQLHVALYSVMAFCYFVEFVTAITGASFTCVGLDCCSRGNRQQSQTIIPMAYAPPPPAVDPTGPPNVTSKDVPIQ